MQDLNLDKWSQRWYDDPPVGTINFDGGRNPEIYVGNGEWQRLAEKPGEATARRYLVRLRA